MRPLRAQMSFPGAVAVCYVSAATGEGIPELMRRLVELVKETGSESSSQGSAEVPVLRPKPKGRRISVVKDAEAYVVHRGELERLIRGTDISDWEAPNAAHVPAGKGRHAPSPAEGWR